MDWPIGDDKPRLVVTQSTASPSMNSQDDKISPRYSLAWFLFHVKKVSTSCSLLILGHRTDVSTYSNII